MEARVGKSVPFGPVAAVLVFAASAVLVATAVSVTAWRYLPYDTLERFTPADRFLVWEGVVWLFALVSIFLSAAVILEVRGWRIDSALQDLAAEFGRREDGVIRISPSILPWWMLACGVAWMAIGILGRSLLAP